MEIKDIKLDMADSFEFRDLDENKVNWTKSSVIRLTELWQEEEVLFNPKHSGYFNREEKKQALRRITKGLALYLPNLDMKEVKKKMMNLRCQYSRELSKYTDSINSGAEPDEIYKPSAFWFPYLEFLGEYIKFRKPRESYNVTTISENTQDMLSNQEYSCDDTESSIDFPYPQKRPKYSKQTTTSSTTYHVDDKNQRTLTRQRCGINDSFLKYISDEMEGITDDAIRTDLRKNIMLQIFEAKEKQIALSESSY